MKKLIDIIKDISVNQIIGDSSVQIEHIAIDSREVRTGSLFIAVKGTVSDGHDFISNSVEKGCVAVVCNELPQQCGDNVTYVLTSDTSSASGYISSAFYNYPSHHLQVIGVTGTNGKTTIATQLFKLFQHMGYRAGLLSTIKNCIHNEEIEATHTTPDPLNLNRLMAQMVFENCTHCFMEVSSHALAQNRVAGIRFAGGVFTNLTHDHLDYHKDFKSYLSAKKKFFDLLNEEAFAISNADDPNGTIMLQNTKAEKLYYSLRKPADFKGVVIENSMEGLQMKIGRNEVHFQLRGRFNAYNLLAVFGVAVKSGFEDQEVLAAMSNLKHVDGRFHLIENTRGIYAVLDYAHTPDALDNVLKSIEELRTRNETLFVVVGAGGNRDKTKRPLMASIAARYANKLILTSDNPRFENPQDIINDMKKGLDAFQMSHTLVIQDRYEAIKTACMMAVQADIILVAGKGHETYQEVNGVKHQFDDGKLLYEFLNM